VRPKHRAKHKIKKCGCRGKDQYPMISSRSASVGPPDTSGPDCRASALGARTARTASRDGWADDTKGILRGQTGDRMGDDNVRWHGLGTTRLTIFVRHAFPHIYSIYFYYCYSVLYLNKINRKKLSSQWRITTDETAGGHRHRVAKRQAVGHRRTCRRLLYVIKKIAA
jgi:hypothetical protein